MISWIGWIGLDDLDKLDLIGSFVCIGLTGLARKYSIRWIERDALDWMNWRDRMDWMD